MSKGNKVQQWVYETDYKTVKMDQIDFQNNIKSSISEDSTTTNIQRAQYVITENSVAVFVNTEVDSEMSRNAEEILGAVVKAKMITTFGLKEFERFDSLNTRIKFSSPEIMDRLVGGVFMFTHTETGVDLLYTNTRGELLTWKTGQPPTEEMLKDVKTFVADKWTDGGVKDVSLIGINAGYFENRKAMDDYLDKVSCGQHKYYKGKELSTAEFSEMIIRRSTDVAPSKNLHTIAKRRGITLPRVSMAIRLDKANWRDGACLGNASEGILAFNAMMKKEYDESAILGVPMQMRAMTSMKAATTWVRTEAMVNIINYELCLVDNATHHFYTYDEIESNPLLRLELMAAFDKENHPRKSGQVIKGTRFKKGDVVSLLASENQYCPTLYLDMNTVKASFDPLCKMGIIVMAIAAIRELSVKVSGQANTSTFAQNEDLAIQYAYNKWVEFFDRHEENLTKPKAKEVVPHQLVKGNFHYNTVVAQAAPQMLLKDKKLFNSYLDKNIVAAFRREINKNATLNVDGVYAYGVPDFGRYFGVEILRHDEIMSADFWSYKKKALVQLAEQINATESLIDSKIISSDENKLNKMRLKNLKQQRKLLKENKISQYRSPKMSIFEIDIRRVLTHKAVCHRIDAFVNAGKLSELQGKILKDMFFNIRFGAVYMSGDVRITKVHSGSDWDIDAFTCIFDPGYNTLLTRIKRVMVEVK